MIKKLTVTSLEGCHAKIDLSPEQHKAYQDHGYHLHAIPSTPEPLDVEISSSSSDKKYVPGF